VDAESGVDPHRVAEVIVTASDGPGRRGSGYRVASGVVLTAAHVVADARSVQLRFDADTPGEWSVAAQDVVADPTSDLAAVLIDAPSAVPADTFGRVGDGTDELAVHAVGFPRFKLKDYAAPSGASTVHSGAYRDSHQAVGTVAPLSNLRSGRLEVTVRPPGDDRDPLASPWEGMSGAALWAGRRIVGVITDHHRADGLGRLAATRITALTDGPAGDAAQRLRDVLGLPAAGLPDVTAPARPVVTSYLLQVRDIAPDRLLGREEELRTLAGSAEPYGWWEGPPWAGKTALMAWFALHPPPDVEVVPFFVGAGRVGRSDVEAFLDAVTEQLTVLATQSHEAPETTADRRRGLLALLDAAARRCRDAGRRLLLVVDGIDEDTGPASREPSIAALLPRHLPAGAAVLVTSRPGRPLPGDVPADHPLHRCTRRRLAVSPHAREVERFARRELGERLRAGRLHESLIGLITASGGGLTRDDLAELTGASPFAVADLLSGAFGRSVTTRTGRPGGAARGYVLAHRTLREAAERELGPRLDEYQARLQAWCEDHRKRGWPAGTPAYLLHDYPRVLAAAGDAAPLAELATDPLRHERLLEVTGGDAAALDEIALAQLVGARRPEPDLVAAVLLAVRREELTSRNRHVPVRLPAVWAALGRGERAAALARGLPKRKQRAALAAAAVAAAEAGHLGDAEALAERVPDRDRRDATLAAVAAAAAVHDPERAERWARRCTPERREGALARIATAIAARDPQRARAIVSELSAEPGDVRDRVAVATAAAVAGEPGTSEALIDGVGRGAARDRVRAALAAALAAAGEVGRAEEVAAGIGRAGARLPALAALVRADVPRGDDAGARRHLTALQEAASAATHRGDAVGELLALAGTVSGHDQAVAGQLLSEAEHHVANGIRDDRKGWALARLAVAHAAVGNAARSEALLDRLVDDADRAAGALGEIAVQAARAGDARRAEAVVRRVPGAARRMNALADVAAAFAAAGDHRRAAARAAEAEGMARRTTDPQRLVTMSARVVDGLLAIDALPAAVEVAEQIADPQARAATLTRVAGALAAFGAIDDAIALAGALGEPWRRSWALVDIGEAQAAAGRRHEAVTTAEAVLADPFGDGYTRVVVLLRLSTALHGVGATDDAERLRTMATRQVVEDVADPGQRARAFAHLSVALAAAGDADGAAVLARRTEAELVGIGDQQRQDRARTRVVEALAAGGRTGWAEEVGRAIVGPAARVRALAALATATPHDPDRAWTLLGRAEEQLDAIGSPADRWTATGRLASAAAVVLAGEGDPADTRRSRITRLVVELLGTDGWVEAIPAVSRLDWEAFDALVDWLATRTAAGFEEKLGRS
jgi:Trypsin-like peptidase domain